MVDYIGNELWIMRNGPGMRHLALLERAWGKSALQSGAERSVTQRNPGTASAAVSGTATLSLPLYRNFRSLKIIHPPPLAPER
jgi:hypothetical protein